MLKWTSTNAVGIVTCTKLSILCTCNVNSTVSVSHLIYFTLPERDNMDYNLRPRYNDRQLIRKSAYISNSLFIVRMLYKDSYTDSVALGCFIFGTHVATCQLDFLTNIRI